MEKSSRSTAEKYLRRYFVIVTCAVIITQCLFVFLFQIFRPGIPWLWMMFGVILQTLFIESILYYAMFRPFTIPSAEHAPVDTGREENRHNRELEKNLMEMSRQAVQVATWFIDTRTRTLTGSAEAQHLFGLGENPADFTVANIEACIPDRERVHQAMSDLVKNGTPYDLEYLINPADGATPRLIISKAALQKDEDGNETMIIGIIQDITVRKQVEEALRQSKERYRALFNENHSVMLLIDPVSGEVKDANFAACRYYGWSHTELCSKHITEINTLSKEEVAAEMENAVKEKRRKFNFRHRLAGGEVRNVEVYSGPITFGGSVLLYSIVHDVTESKHVEAALQESEAKYRFITENTSDGIITFGPDHKITYVSPAYLAQMGFTEQEELDRTTENIYSTIHPDDRDDVFPKIFKAIEEHKGVLVYIYRVKHKAGHYFWREDNAKFKYDPSGNYRGAYVICRDITERKHAEEALISSEYRWKFAIEGHGDGVWDWNIISGEVKYSKLWKEMLGYNADEIQDAPHEWVDRIHPDDRTDVENNLQKYIEGKAGSYSAEYRLRCKNGTYKWVLGRGMAVNRSVDGRPTRLIGTHSDISERKQMEKALKENNELFTLLMRHSPIYSYIKEVGQARSTVLQCSDNFFEMVGVKSSEMIGKDMSELFPHDFAVKIIADDWAVVSKGDVISLEEELNGRKYSTIKFPISQGKKKLLAGYTIDITERNQAEVKLRKNEERLRSLFANMTEGFSIQDVICDESGKPCDLRFIEANPAFEQQTGLKNVDTLGHTLRELFPTSEQYWIDRYGKVGLTGESISFEGMFGPLKKYYQVNAFQTKPGQFGVMFTDINERKQAETAIMESEEKHRAIIQTAMDGYWMTDSQGNFLETNETYCRMSGYTKQELLSMRISDIETMETSVDTAARIQKIIANGDDRFESKHRRKDGSMYDVEVSIQYRLIEGGRLVAFLQDITDRKRAEEALRESEKNFSALADNAHDGILIADSSGRHCYANKRATEITGYGIDEILHLNMSHLAHPDEISKLTERLRKRIAGEIIPNPYRTRIVTKSGGIVSIEVSSAQTIWQRQQADLVIIRDITERENSEQALRQAQKQESIGTLAGGIAHDFNNLLNAMMGNVELAIKRIPVDSPAVKNLERTHTAMQRAATLTKQMLAYSGKGRFQTVKIDMVKVAQEHIDLFEASLPKNVTFSTAFSPEPVTINGDPGQIEQVVMNLLINAGEAIVEKQGNVNINVSVVHLSGAELLSYSKINNHLLKAGEYALLQVSDNGIGMSEETLTKIFDPFFTTKFVGRGLGLAAVLGIVRGHNGGITVQSTKGSGTTFRVVFPFHQSAGQSIRRKDAAGSSAAHRPTVLLIDDEQYIIDLTYDIFSDTQYHLLSATDPVLGVTIYKEQWKTMDVVILDYSMQKMNGKDVLIELRKINPKVKVIMSSGYSDEELTKLMGDVTPSVFIQKPHSSKALFAVLNTVLQQM